MDCEGQEVSGFFWKEDWRRITRVERNVERMQEDIMPSADLESTVIPKRTLNSVSSAFTQGWHLGMLSKW